LFKPFLNQIPGIDKNILKGSVLVRRILNAQYDSLKDSYQNKLLWTADIDASSYSDASLFSGVVLKTEALKGVVNPNSTLQFEFNAEFSLTFSDDSTVAGKDLNRSVLSGEFGGNLSFKNRSNNHSIAELKLTGALNDVTSGNYAGEEKGFFTLNGTFRIRLGDDFWIPIEFKYDPESGNVLGFLNVTSNFEWLRKSKNK